MCSRLYKMRLANFASLLRVRLRIADLHPPQGRDSELCAQPDDTCAKGEFARTANENPEREAAASIESHTLHITRRRRFLEV